MVMRISRHAAERYVERVIGRDRGEALGNLRLQDEAKELIASDLARYQIGLHQTEYRLPIGDIVYVIKDGEVITVLTKAWE